MEFRLNPLEPQILSKGDLKVLFVATEQVSPDIKQLGKKTPLARHMFGIYYCVLSKEHNDFIPPQLYRSYSLVVDKYLDGEDVFYRSRFGFGDALQSEVPADFVINPKGFGIGSIIINQLIAWGKDNYPNVTAPQIKLSAVDESNKVMWL